MDSLPHAPARTASAACSACSYRGSLRAMVRLIDPTGAVDVCANCAVIALFRCEAGRFQVTLTVAVPGVELFTS